MPYSEHLQKTFLDRKRQRDLMPCLVSRQLQSGPPGSLGMRPTPDCLNLGPLPSEEHWNRLSLVCKNTHTLRHPCAWRRFGTGLGLPIDLTIITNGCSTATLKPWLTKKIYWLSDSLYLIAGALYWSSASVSHFIICQQVLRIRAF